MNVNFFQLIIGYLDIINFDIVNILNKKGKRDDKMLTLKFIFLICGSL